VNSRRLVLRSLRHYGRTHLGAFLTAALTAAVITAALGVGDSVDTGMERVAAARLGRVRYAAHAPGRLWRAELAGEVAGLHAGTVSASLQLNGSLARPDGTARIHGARVLGVDDAFWSLSPSGRPPLSPWPEAGVAVSERVAAQLGVSVGDSLVVRMESPSMVPRDAVMAAGADAVTPLLVEVAAVLDADHFGSFALTIGARAPANVFMPLDRLQTAVGERGMANALLMESGRGELGLVRELVLGNLGLEDAGLSLRRVGPKGSWELVSRRIFIEEAVANAAVDLPGANGVLAWFVNDIGAGDRHTPYSMVAALPPGSGPVPDDLADDEILVNTWLAEDLGVGEGDPLSLTYFVVSDGGGLVEQSARFRVGGVVPIEGDAADPTLMPAFPGLTGARNCRDWDPGFTIDLSRIRDADEAYWDEHGGTPKAFVTLRTGRRLWGNRFGTLTGVRYDPGSDPAAIEAAVLGGIDPAAIGLSFTDVGAAAAAARENGSDFGSLFLGFSAFLTGAALLLTGLVVALNVSMRQREIATLLALGFTRRRVRRLFAVEHALVAMGGGVLGTAGGIALMAAALAALGTVWNDVAGSLPLDVVVRPGTVLAGALGGAAVSFLAALLVLRLTIGRSVHDAFLRSEELAARIARGRARRCVGAWVALGFLIAATARALLAGAGRDAATAGAFFGAGALLLAASLSFVWYALAHLGGAREGRRPSVRGLAWSNLGRRRGRSLTTIGVLAFGVFMFLGVTVFRRDRLATADDPASGTGGFALVGESAVAVVRDLNTPEGRRSHGLADADLEGVRVVGLRVREGDDASCLNLTRAQTPEILGVDPRNLAGRFTFVEVDGEPDDPWSVLAAESADGAVPAVIDQATFWTLGKGLGDTIAITDEAGRPFHARIAGVIDNAVLHGRLVISERAFLERFPSESGYRRFLIEVPAGRADEVAATLSRNLEDFGLSLERAEVRLNAQNAVENTYLGIFQALGGIGLLLGSAGLALVVGRNTLERRAELALLGAVGFSRSRIVRLVTLEHAVLLLLGLLAGLSASVLSLLPALFAPGARVATPGAGAVLLGLAVGGILWTRLAARIALRGSLLGNLREDG